MTIKGHAERIDLAIMNLGKKDIYLGHNWLKRHNPSVNWKMQSILFGRCSCAGNAFSLPDSDPDDKWDEELKEGDTILAVSMEEELVIWAMHHANDLATTANAEKPKKSFVEMVPEHYHSFRDLFSKENFDELPERKPWDHAIELTPNAKSTLDCKIYPLNRNEQEQLDAFLDENLESGHIRPSKSPFASPFFFVRKRMARSVQFRTTASWTRWRLRTDIHSLSSQNSSTSSGEPNISWSSTFIGDTTMSESGRATRKKPPSAWTGACLSPPSCSSGSLIHPPHFNGWWTTSSATWSTREKSPFTSTTSWSSPKTWRNTERSSNESSNDYGRTSFSSKQRSANSKYSKWSISASSYPRTQYAWIPSRSRESLNGLRRRRSGNYNHSSASQTSTESSSRTIRKS